ncbi:MAG: orotate phosphoribosyltransferase, partial [Candidatus Thorarchaeota archaeon]
TPQLAQLAVKLKVTGVIAPGTRPQHVSEIRTLVGNDTLILAPGVGAQGGKPGSAISAGADYEIVGRTIYSAKNPIEIAKELAKKTYSAIPIIQSSVESRAESSTILALLLDDVGAIKFGEFKLASGKPSPYYIDLRLVPSYPAAFTKLSDLLVQWFLQHPKIQFNRIAGVPTAGLSFATTISNRLNMPLLYVRSKPKKYGRQKHVEGILQKGDHVLVIDDLISDGGSKIEVAEALRTAGAKVTDVLVVVDREQNGAKLLEAKQLTLHALAPISEIVKALHKEKRLSTQKANRILSYISKQK